MKRALTLLASLCTCVGSVFGQVVAKVQGSTTTYTQDVNGNITVPLGTFTTDKLIRVYDPNSSQQTLPIQSLFSLTVSARLRAAQS